MTTLLSLRSLLFIIFALLWFGCDPSSSVEERIVAPSEAAKALGITGYADVVIDTTAAADSITLGNVAFIQATVYHEDARYNGARIASHRNPEVGTWHITVTPPQGAPQEEKTAVTWHYRSGAVEVSGPHGKRSVASFKAFASKAAYEEESADALRPYTMILRLAAKMNADLTPRMTQRRPKNMPPIEGFEPNYLTPEQVKRVEEQRIRQQRGSEVSVNPGTYPSGVIRPASLTSPRLTSLASTKNLGSGRDLTRECVPGLTTVGLPAYRTNLLSSCVGRFTVGMAYAWTRLRACYYAKVDAIHKCTNQWCFGCRCHIGCETICSLPEYDLLCSARHLAVACTGRFDFLKPSPSE